jgi:mannan endo-1,4-beta-mannosidase
VSPFCGFNLWQAMWWGANDRPRLGRELDRLRAIGATTVRIVAAGEGPDDAPYRVTPSLTPRPGEVRGEILEGLVHALDALEAREMDAIVCLGNFWHWTGGVAQLRAWCDGSSIPYPVGDEADWNAFARYAAGFFESKEAMALFEAHVDTVVGAIGDHHAVRILEVMNEPRGMHVPTEMRAALHHFVDAIRAKSAAPITLGSEGSTLRPDVAGLSFREDHDHPGITHTTIHLWPENWGVWDPKADDDASFAAMLEWARGYVRAHAEVASALDRPLIIEELGLARDLGRRDPDAPTRRRDAFFEAVADEMTRARREGLSVEGILFWAWAGEALGDEGRGLGGDPPHEPPGWYGIGANDRSTHEIVENVCRLARRGAKRS